MLGKKKREKKMKNKKKRRLTTSEVGRNEGRKERGGWRDGPCRGRGER